MTDTSWQEPDDLVGALENLKEVEAKLCCAQATIEHSIAKQNSQQNDVAGAVLIIKECISTISAARNVLDEAAVNGDLVCKERCL